MAETENMKLALPANNEYVDIEVLNENFRKIDTKALLALAAASPYSTSQTYAVGAYCTRGGRLYKAKQSISTAEAWNAAHWAATTMGAELVAVWTSLSDKAPAGYGLGENEGKSLENVDLDTVFKAGVYYVKTGCTHVPDGTSNSWSNLVVICGRVPVQEYYPANGGADGEWSSYLRRIYHVTKGWQPWEWVNPPMKLGVEYRTTERYQEKPVYAKVVYFGKLPNNTEKAVSHGIANLSRVVSVEGDTNGENIVGSRYITYAYIDSVNIRIKTNTDHSAFGANVLIKYTKNAD